LLAPSTRPRLTTPLTRPAAAAKLQSP
jgi:hypothetical protein